MPPLAVEKKFFEAQISIRIVLPIFFAIVSSLGIPAAIWYACTSSGFDMFLGILVFLCMLLLWLIMVWGELRRKALCVRFKEHVVETQTFFGFGKKQVYPYELFKGYHIGLLPALPKPYEQLIMVVGERQVFAVSEFYLSNYAELKTFISEHFAYLGVKKYNQAEEFRKIVE